MIYLDTAALVKLLRPEPESEALADWLDGRMDTLLVTSTLTEVELPRALRRIDAALLPQVPALLERLARHESLGTVHTARGPCTSPDVCTATGGCARSGVPSWSPPSSTYPIFRRSAADTIRS
ncbi:type II toxin-antitoxin system VapC family toxin [Pseudonocardia nigra]|uniref:type II toxin-antitoxin system VapC family toxin n=1 Tax=Pseudonocardia nigra TaxID=1921578 RepID=UPI001C600AEF|nr:type II toxin-antitoxin system VapC family toxin [Pseudonocardia nigra]